MGRRRAEGSDLPHRVRIRSSSMWQPAEPAGPAADEVGRGGLEKDSASCKAALEISKPTPHQRF